MKGIVFSLGKKSRPHRFVKKPERIRSFSLKRFFNYYGIQFFFVVDFVLGLVLGSSALKSASSELLNALDFLFVTNLDNRLKLSAFDIFCSAFASDFIFVFIVFLLNFASWGIFALPLVCAFKGFGVGISSAYMFSQYGISGIGFYILIILPGTVLFLLAFITALKEAFIGSYNLLKMYFPSARDGLLYRYTKTYLYRNFVILLFVAFSAIIDMIFWVLFANMFNF